MSCSLPDRYSSWHSLPTGIYVFEILQEFLVGLLKKSKIRNASCKPVSGVGACVSGTTGCPHLSTVTNLQLRLSRRAINSGTYRSTTSARVSHSRPQCVKVTFYLKDEDRRSRPPRPTSSRSPLQHQSDPLSSGICCVFASS